MAPCSSSNFLISRYTNLGDKQPCDNQEENLVENCKVNGAKFIEGLNKLLDHPLVGEVRGVGLVAAIELVTDKDNKTALEPAGRLGAIVAAELQKNGVIIRAMMDAIAFCPPMIIKNEQIEELLDKISKSLDSAKNVAFEQ